MLDQPITVGSLLIINSATVIPIIILVGKGVWYLSKMTHQHDQMWEWFSLFREDRRSKPRRVTAADHD